MYEEKFQNILGEDEKIVKISRVKKSTFFIKKIIGTIISICILVGLCYYIKFVLSLSGQTSNTNWMNYAYVGIAIIVLLNLIVSFKASSNYFICLTNKRIIIRYGTFTNNYNQYSIDTLKNWIIPVTLTNLFILLNT